jgi:hypothetical protein
MTLSSLVSHNRQLLVKYSKEFRDIFHTSLNQYLDSITGFDSIKFDEEFLKSGNKSMVSVLKKKYGQESVLLIEKLIQSPDSVKGV